MSTSIIENAKSRRAYFPTSALAKMVEFDELTMHIRLADGRVLQIPLTWFPVLQRATSEQRNNYERSAAEGSVLIGPTSTKTCRSLV